MESEVLGIISIGLAILNVLLSLPLALRKVPMNSVYGIRFRQSFVSKAAWYEINAHGAKLLILVSVPILLCGLYGVVANPENYQYIALSVWIASYSIGCFGAYRKARKYDLCDKR